MADKDGLFVTGTFCRSVTPSIDPLFGRAVSSARQSGRRSVHFPPVFAVPPVAP